MDSQGGVTSWLGNSFEPQKKPTPKQKVNEPTEKVNKLAKSIKGATPEETNPRARILKPKETKETLLDTVLKVNIANDKNDIKAKLKQIETEYGKGNFEKADKLLNEYSIYLQSEFPKIVIYKQEYSINYENQDFTDIIQDIMDSESNPEELRDNLQLLRSFSEAEIDRFYQSVSKNTPEKILKALPKLAEIQPLLDTIPDYVPTSKVGIEGFAKDVEVRRHNVRSKPVETKDHKRETQELDQPYTEYLEPTREQRARLTPEIYIREIASAYLQEHTLNKDSDYKTMHKELYHQTYSYLDKMKVNKNELLPIYRKKLMDEIEFIMYNQIKDGHKNIDILHKRFDDYVKNHVGLNLNDVTVQDKLKTEILGTFANEMKDEAKIQSHIKNLSAELSRLMEDYRKKHMKH